MKIVHSSNEMLMESRQARRDGRRIGFVPTMGFLHEGHLSLIRKAREASNFLVVSVFVNPTQFGVNEDFNSYPRNTKHDKKLCQDEDVDVMFCPSADEMYADNHSVYVEELDLAKGLCGAFRPGHFRGVTTIVAKLFNIVQPDVAVFGQKDAQQARIIEQMVQDLNFPVEIIIAPIVREADGLAMSSRNTYLSGMERKRATCIYKSLCLAENLVAEGIKDTAVIKKKMREVIEGNFRFSISDLRLKKEESIQDNRQSAPILHRGDHKSNVPVKIDYIETVDYRTLKQVDRIEGVVLIAVAARIGRTRLIDNIIICFSA